MCYVFWFGGVLNLNWEFMLQKTLDGFQRAIKRHMFEVSLYEL